MFLSAIVPTELFHLQNIIESSKYIQPGASTVNILNPLFQLRETIQLRISTEAALESLELWGRATWD